jgi:poly-gamma-glutamate capsule biosynthesis protein CapA/YwtB (metallophosphatase superfamily)
MIRIIVGGDICPAGAIQDAFIKGNAEAIFHDISEEISVADLSVVNLECPLISKHTPIVKAGDVMAASSECRNGFVAAGWDVLNLANNHSYDHGACGLRDTIHTLERAGLSIVGAGMNIAEAQRPFVTQISGQRIVLFAMAEHEFSEADEKTPGANPLDLINFVNAVRLYKLQGFFIVLVHGGQEYYPYPSPEMIRRCRFMVDMGADAVICCHTHCALPWEIHSNRPIIYGLGNLVFESPCKEPESWYEGYLARLTIEAGQVHFEAIPYTQFKNHQLGARMMDQDARNLFFADMNEKNSKVNDNAFISDKWLNHCRQQRHTYLASLFGYNRLIHRMRNLLLRTLYSKKDILRALHLVHCETHQEVLNTIFKEERSSK